jgi:hypothetical protein
MKPTKLIPEHLYRLKTDSYSIHVPNDVMLVFNRIIPSNGIRSTEYIFKAIDRVSYLSCGIICMIESDLDNIEEDGEQI